MKKLILSIIGISVLITVFSYYDPLRAEEPGAAVLKKCESKLPKYPSAKEAIVIKPNTHLGFRLAYENASNAYHDYIKCIFDEASSSILESAGDDLDNAILAAGAPSFPNLLKPNVACLTPNELTKILKSSSPKNLLQPLLDAYNKYTDYLNRLTHLLDETPTGSGSDAPTIRDFDIVFGKRKILLNIIESEIQNSLVALDAAFISLNEMRQAFTMHVHLQCMLKNLEDYRRMLGNVRSVITVIPGVIEDCSMHK